MSDVQPINFDPEDMTDLYTLYKSDPEFVKVLKQNANNEFLKNNGGGGGEGGDITASQITDSTAIGRSVLTAATAAAARTAIGAGTGNGTSNLAIGTTSTTAKAGNYQPTAANISDATAVGRSVLTATDAAAARTAIGAGTSNLALGTTATTAKAGDYQPTWAQVSGKPTTFAPVVATATVTGGVKAAASQADSVAADIETLVADFNSLLAKLKAAGIML